MKGTIEKPTFPHVRRFSPTEIKDIRKGYGLKMTQVKFARFFPVSLATIKAWEGGHRVPYGPCSVRLQELKAWVDQEADEKQAAFDKMMKRNGITEV